MQDFTSCISYGAQDIIFEVKYMRRKILEIAVHPDKTVRVKAPFHASRDVIEARVRKRAKWIMRQMSYFSQFEPRTPPRQYIGGESHLYLGRKYRLKFVEGQADSQKDTEVNCNRIVLRNGYFHVESTNKSPENAKKLLKAWYRERAKTVFAEILHKSFEKFSKYNIEMPKMLLCTMKTRWGSYSTQGILRLNIQLIQAPKQCIEYVIVHELCHALHHSHNNDFYTLLEQILPDWTQRKHKLELAMV